MKGTEKQVVWANNILAKFVNDVSGLESDLQGKMDKRAASGKSEMPAHTAQMKTIKFALGLDFSECDASGIIDTRASFEGTASARVLGLNLAMVIAYGMGLGQSKAGEMLDAI